MEQTNPARKTIIVEDLLSKQIIDGVLRELGQATASLFNVTFYTGGESVIKEHFISVYSHANERNKFIVFDGDQRHAHFNPDSIVAAEQTNERYQHEIQNQTGVNVKFYPDGNPNAGARADQEKVLREKYLKFYLRNVSYLPLSVPEEIIWNQVLAETILTAMGKIEYIQRINATQDFKEKFLLVAEAMTGDKRNIEASEKTFLEKWLSDKPNSYNDIVTIIESIRALNG